MGFSLNSLTMEAILRVAKFKDSSTSHNGVNVDLVEAKLVFWVRDVVMDIFK